MNKRNIFSSNHHQGNKLPSADPTNPPIAVPTPGQIHEPMTLPI